MCVCVQFVCALEKKGNGLEMKEHATWVKKQLNNKIHQGYGQYFASSHERLFIFRKKQLRYTSIKMWSIRHQRTCDVLESFVVHDEKTGEEVKPHDWVYYLCENIVGENLYYKDQPTFCHLWVNANWEPRVHWLMLEDYVHLE